ncbi:HRDC domain-containing protein [Neolewinella antarctica]|uniref:HRDC domain-containing protein n=1 Tax=Neolewinella antarctica TaxID=442734 RepID=A0ABX0XE81_9BACT|nr:HRDC domain-containing protein [Neolewinella antarctica]NJC27214.1 hypothetical protein [Neolewinella antarctica]
MLTTATINAAQELAFEYVAYTNRHVFLTGKAGTGKTTFLHRVKREVTKRTAVVAPTGVAAINAGAQTIHSLFTLPLGFIPPGQKIERMYQLSRQKRGVLRNIDLLIIDEISMVRADVLDAIDTTLQSVRNNMQPFGGVQLLMIGDLHQLAPVVRGPEGDKVLEHYDSPYYFSAKVMARAAPVNIPLTHIYRQKDGDFIDLLNKVRNNELDDEVVSLLNSRYRPESSSPDEEGAITLTSHNRTATTINKQKLARQPGLEYVFDAEVKDKFPESMFPNDRKLQFKVGAQVMFNRNDTQEQRYYNGKIGRITNIEDETITVRCPDEEALSVLPVIWENMQKSVDELSGELKDKTIGTYRQHPLRLAWAITIHKSQGLTFEKLSIDAADSFTHGQVYVALSRCRTFGGITLRSRINRRSVRTDKLVADHSKAAELNKPTPDDLAADRLKFQFVCLNQLFDFTEVSRQATHVAAIFGHPQTVITGGGKEVFRTLREELDRDLVIVGLKSRKHLAKLRAAGKNPEQDESVQQWLATAAGYFNKYLAGPLGQRLTSFTYVCENKSVQARLDEGLEELRRGYFIKRQLFAWVASGFTALEYLNTRLKARYDFDRLGRAVSTDTKPVRTTADDGEHAELLNQLKQWRKERADELQIPAYRVASNAVLGAISTFRPVTESALLKVKGIGKRKAAEHGDDILRIVKLHNVRKGSSANQRTGGAGTESNGIVPTKQGSALALLQEGIPVAEVAQRRGVKVETMFNYVANWVRDGELTARGVLGSARHEELASFLEGYTLTDMGVLAERGRGRFVVGEIKVGLVGRE